MKLLNKVRVLAIILIGVTLIFAVLGSMQIDPVLEGFDDKVVGCSGEIVPSCHEKLLSHAKYEEDPMDDYILKTEVVVPTCPMCPKYKESKVKPLDSDEGVAADAGDAEGNSDTVDNNELTDEKEEEEEEEEEDKKYKYHKYKEDDKYDSNKYNGYHDRKYNDRKYNDRKYNDRKYNDRKYNEDKKNKEDKMKDVDRYVGLAGSATPMTSVLDPVSSPAPANNKDTPPCPACERCPEPAFECKKVPNYRSPSMQNYMPLPVLNDFSKF
jgi:hypothetical protein